MALSETIKQRIASDTAKKKGQNMATGTASAPLSDEIRARIKKDTETKKMAAASTGAAVEAQKAGYQQRPVLMVERESLESKLSQQSVSVKNAEAEARTAAREKSGWESTARELAAQYNAAPSREGLSRYQKAYSNYEKASKVYSNTATAYQSAVDSYNALAGEYKNYITLQRTQYDQWKQAIRDPEIVKQELTQIDSQIAEQEDKKMVYNMNRTLVLQGRLPAGTEGTDPQFRIDQLTKKKELLQEEYDWGKFFQYEQLRDATDFEKNSAYKSTANNKKRSAMDIMMNNYTAQDSGWDDPLYEFINGNEEAGAYISNQAAAGAGSDLGAFMARGTESKAEVRQMTPDEVKTFNYIYATQGQESAHKYYEYLRSDLNERQRAEEEQYWSGYAKENPVGSSVFSAMMSPMKGLSYLGQAADYLTTGQIDQNAAYNKFSYVPNSIREQVSNKIEESGKWGSVGSFAYQTGMSMADFLVNTAITGGSQPLTLAIMGTGAAADTVISAKDRGLDDRQAFTLGTIAGAAEIVAEKFSIEALLNPNFLRDGAAKYILKNMGTEGAEEGATSIVNLLADIIVSKDKSEWKKSIDAYVAAGKTEKDAFWLAVIDHVALDVLGGAISGGLMSGIGSGFRVNSTTKLGKELGALKMSDEEIQTFIKTGLESDHKSDAYHVAKAMQEKLNSGKKLSNYDLARLYQVNVQEQPNLQWDQTDEEDAEATAGDSVIGDEQTGVVVDDAADSLRQRLPSLEDDAQIPRAVTQNSQNVTQSQKIETAKPGEITAQNMLDQAKVDLREGRISEEAFDAVMDDVMHMEELENGTSILNLDTEAGQGVQAEQVNAAPISVAERLRQEQNLNGGEQYENEQPQELQLGATFADGTAGVAATQPAGGNNARQGAGVSDGVQGRTAGAGTAEQAGSMAGSAGRPWTKTTGGAKTFSERKNVAQDLWRKGIIQDTSSEELGVPSGTSRKNLLVYPRAVWDQELIDNANRIKEETGCDVRYVFGEIEVSNRKGMMYNVRGAYYGDQIIVQVDNETATPVQLSDHEAFHAKVHSEGQRLMQGIREAITEKYSEAEFAEVYDRYFDALWPLYCPEDNASREEFEEALNAIEEEFFADAYAGINAFGANADRFTEVVKEEVDQLYMGKLRNQENGTEEPTGPPEEKFSYEDREELSLQTLEDETESDYEGRSLINDPEIYTYEFLTAQPPMKPVELPDVADVRDSQGRIDPAKVVQNGMKNALSVGTEKAGKIYVKNRYTGRELWVTTSAIRHGLNGASNRMLTNARLGAMIGDIVQNAIPINALNNTADGIDGTYAMTGYAFDEQGREFVAIVTVEQRTNTVTDINTYDMTHAISGRQKRSKQADTKSQGVNPSMLASEEGSQADTKSQGFNLIKASSKISIADLLADVKKVYQSILSEDVLAHMGETRDAKGHYTGRVRYSYAGENANNTETQQNQDEKSATGISETRSNMTTKERDVLRGVETQLLRNIGKALGVSRFGDRNYLKSVIQGLSDAYMETGTIEQKTMDDLFEQAYRQGIVVDREMHDQYEELLKYLRTVNLTLDPRDRGDIADYPDFVKRTRGRMRIVNKGGLPVDSAWHELNEMAPELFPESIAHPADQLVRMAEVLASLQIAEKSLNDYYGPMASTYKKDAKAEFERVVWDSVGELRQIRRFEQERQQRQQESEPAPTTPEEAMEAWTKLKTARKTYEKAMAKHLLTPADEMQVGRLLRGEILPEHLVEGRDYIKGIIAVYEAKQEYERLIKLLSEYRKKVRADLRADADGYLETANTWKDKSIGLAYSRETMQRNVEDIVPDRKLAKAINERYFEPVRDAEAAAVKLKDEYREAVRKLNLSRKVQKGNLVSEAHAVQLYGEAMDNIRILEKARGRLRHRDGKSLEEWRGVMYKLWQENPGLEKAKIENAVAEMRRIYDELFQKMNEVRVRWGYEPVNYRQGYFPHFQPGDGDGIMAQFGRVLGIDTQVVALPTTINGLTHTFKPGIQWFGNAQERLGFNTAYDAVEGFDRYVEGVASVICQTENIQRLRTFASQIRYRTSDEGIRKQVDAIYSNPTLTEEQKNDAISGIYEKGRYTLSNFVVEVDEYTNLLTNKKSKLDRTVEALIGRKFYTAMKWLESRVGANMIAGNMTSALTNFIPLTQASAQLSKKAILQGMWDTLKSYRTSDGFIERSAFLTNRRGSDPLIKSWTEKTSEILGKPMEWIDSFVSGSIVRAAYRQNIKRGLSESEAMHQADIFASRVMAERSKGGMPTLFESKNPFFKLFTQFQLEVNNQWSEVFKDIPRSQREKGLGTLALVFLQYFLGAWLFNNLYEKWIGRRPAMDPIDIVLDTVKDFTTDDISTTDALGNLANNVLEELPFTPALTLAGIETDGGRVPVSSGIPNIPTLVTAATNENWAPEKRWKEAQDELNKLAYVFPPFGGNQVSKIWKGVKAYIEGGSYSVNSDGNDILQYPVYNDEEGDFWSVVQAMFMGKSSLDEAQEWVNDGFDSLSAKQTAVYQDMLEAGEKEREAYSLIDELRTAPDTDEVPKNEAQADIILNASSASENGRAIAFYGLVATDNERLLMDSLADVGAQPGTVTDAIIHLREAGVKSGIEKKAIQANVLIHSGLTEPEKEVVIRSWLDDQEVNEDGNLTSLGKFNLAMKQGITTEEYLRFRATGMEIDKLLEYTEAGFEADEAQDLAQVIHDLDPLLGEDRVSTLQKWRASVDFSDDADDQLAALSMVMTDSQLRSVEMANEFGIQPRMYVDFCEVRSKYDADGNGSYKQTEIQATIDGGFSHLSQEQKAVLWQLMNGSTKSAKNNPYSQEVGQRVLDAKAAEKAAEVSEEEPKGLTLGSW